MPRKRAFVHIGLPKTGTKSIQFALARRRSKLAQAGWFFPVVGASSSRSGHHGLAWYLQGASHQHPALLRFDLGSFRSAVAAAAGQNIIISSEELSPLNDEGAIRSLLSLFPAHEVYVVAYVREQAELLNSLYAELLETLNYFESIDDFVTRSLAAGSCNYQKFFGVWRRMLGDRLLIRPFDQEVLSGGDVVSDFEHLLGIGDALYPLPVEYENARSNPMQVAALAGIAQTLAGLGESWVPFSDRHRHFRKVTADILQDPGLTWAQSYWGIGPVLVRQIRDHYRTSNEQFFSEVTGASLRFSSPRRVRKRNSVAYGELPLQLRARLERKLLDGVRTAPGARGREKTMRK